jgi:threonine synthase
VVSLAHFRNKLLDRGLLKRGERVVIVNTGSAEKYLPELRHLLD